MRKPTESQIAILAAVAILLALLVWAGPYLYFAIVCRLAYCDL